MKISEPSTILGEYKCRRCGSIDQHPEGIPKQHDFDSFHHNHIATIIRMGESIHHCDDNSLGISDLIGFVKESK